MRKIKLLRACNVNGSQWRLKKGDILEEAKTGPWIIDHLLNTGMAKEVKERKNKNLGEHYG